MDTDLNEIKNLFNRTKKHRLTKRLIALTLALLLYWRGRLGTPSARQRNFFAFMPYLGGAKERSDRLG